MNEMNTALFESESILVAGLICLKLHAYRRPQLCKID